MGVNESDTNIDQRTVAGAPVSTAGGQPSETRFIAGNFNYLDVLFDHYGVLGVLGFTWSETDTDGYTDAQRVARPARKNRNSLLTVGGEVGRQVGDMVPYVFGYYEFDLIQAPRGGGVGGNSAAETDQSAVRIGAESTPWSTTDSSPPSRSTVC